MNSVFIEDPFSCIAIRCTRYLSKTGDKKWFVYCFLYWILRNASARSLGEFDKYKNSRGDYVIINNISVARERLVQLYEFTPATWNRQMWRAPTRTLISNVVIRSNNFALLFCEKRRRKKKTKIWTINFARVCCWDEFVWLWLLTGLKLCCRWVFFPTQTWPRVY